MCRLLGVVSSERTNFRFALHQAPRSLAALSRDHPHGWGVAFHNSGEGWTLQKSAMCARDDARFHEVAAAHRGEVLVAHVRLRTVGPMTVENTHPFQRGCWVFAHNGTITEVEYLRARSSPARLSELEGETDSELFFTFLLTRLDAVGAGAGWTGAATDDALRAALDEALARPSFGACNFILSDGDVTYVHRFGRSLHLLERKPPDAVRQLRASIETGAVVETPWSGQRHGLLVASEQMTDEPWEQVDEGALLRLDRLPAPCCTCLSPSSLVTNGLSTRAVPGGRCLRGG